MCALDVSASDPDSQFREFLRFCSFNVSFSTECKSRPGDSIDTAGRSIENSFPGCVNGE